MNRYLLAGACAVVFQVAIAAPVIAQYSPYTQPGYGSGYSPYSGLGYGPYGRPSLSPYLNLLRGGNPAANYYLGVVPEVERRTQSSQFRTELRDLESRPPSVLNPTNDLLPPLSETGHGTTFMNFTPYYSYGSLGTYFGSSTGINQSRSRTPSQGRR